MAHGARDADNERKNGHDDERPERRGIHQLGRTNPVDRLTLHSIGDFFSPSSQVLNATSGGI